MSSGNKAISSLTARACAVGITVVVVMLATLLLTEPHSTVVTLALVVTALVGCVITLLTLYAASRRSVHYAKAARPLINPAMFVLVSMLSTAFIAVSKHHPSSYFAV